MAVSVSKVHFEPTFPSELPESSPPYHLEVRRYVLPGYKLPASLLQESPIILQALTKYRGVYIEIPETVVLSETIEGEDDRLRL
jgi:hypothetical protein